MTTGNFAGPEGHVDVAVVVVTYNSADDIGHLLTDLRYEALDQSIRVVVVDNDSSDRTIELVSEHPDVVLVSAGANIGYAGGINVARGHAGDCRAILVLNPDLRIRPGAVAVMLDALDNRNVGVVVPRIVGDDVTYPSLRAEPTVRNALGDTLFGHHLARRPAWMSETVWDPAEYGYPHAVDWATGAALLVRSDVDRAVGDWDERYFLYSEEVDYLRRVRESGYAVWFDPAAVVAHRGAGSGSSPALSTLMVVNRVRYFRSHHGKMHSGGMRAAVVLGELLRSYDRGHRATLGVLCNSARWTELPSAAPVPSPTGRRGLGAVIVPAHNESAVIGRTLKPLAAAAAHGTIELIVVCNGCSDDTAEIARSYVGVTVVETAEASKVVALNLGDTTATLWPRLYLDADTEVTISAVAQVFDKLRAGSVLAARPSSKFDVDGADRIVRSYYRARSRIAWFRTALWGAGAYGLSEAGHDRIGRFPALTGDDLWVDAQFATDEKSVVATEPTTVVVPRDLRSLLHILQRGYRGKSEIAEAPPAGRTLRAMLGSARGPRSAWDAGVYIVLTLVARRRAGRARSDSWERDDSSRTAYGIRVPNQPERSTSPPLAGDTGGVGEQDLESSIASLEVAGSSSGQQFP